MKKIWVRVPKYESHYSISNSGELRRETTGNGTWVGRILKPLKNKGYLRYQLTKNAKKKYFSAHRLVWISFNGPIPPDLQINHKNGKKDDNRLDNLELMTPSQNTKHAYQVLGIPGKVNPNPGSKNGRAKLKESDIPEIFRLRATGLSQQKIADLFGVDQTNISLILRKIGWKHVKNQ